jgi:exopolysaccharide production protein ExoQ
MNAPSQQGTTHHRHGQAGGVVHWVRDDRFGVLLGLMVWALVVLMIVPENFNYALLNLADGQPLSGSALSRLQWLLLMATGAVLMLWRPGLAWLLLRWFNPFLLAFAALAVLSVTWSVEPTVTVRRLIRLFTILLVCIGFGLAAWHPRRFQTVLRPILTLMLGGSLIFGLLLPAYAVHQEISYELVGAWRGLTSHKNTLGAVASISVIFWTQAWLSREVRLLPVVLGLGVALACLLLSRSTTSMFTTVFVVLFLFLLLRGPQMLRRALPWCVGLFVVLLLVYAVAVLRLIPGTDLLLGPVTLITGKDLSFTGRSEIWAVLVEHIRFSPWLGTGYGAYWIGPLPHSPSYAMVLKLYFYPGSAHNGYLEIVNDLGFAGLACLIGYMFSYLWQALRVLHVDRPQGALYLALFMQQAVSNLSETHWLSVLNLDFVIMTLATAALARSALEHRLRQYYGAPTTSAMAPPAAGLQEGLT